MFLFIPLEAEPANTRIIAGTAIMEDNNYGGQSLSGGGNYCDQFYTQETIIIDENTKQILFFKVYCSI